MPNLEEELRQWRAARLASPRLTTSSVHVRRTVRVRGAETLVVTRPRRQIVRGQSQGA